MYVTCTYQDWAGTLESERPDLLETIIGDYKASREFRDALEADEYFRGNNKAVGSKVLLQPQTVPVRGENGKERKALWQKEIIGNRIFSGFLSRFVCQQNQFLLGNGVTLDSPEQKERLGLGFDHALQQAGEKALLHGVCWGYWNLDRLEVIPAAVDARSGFVALLDERTGAARVGIQFWQLAADKPMWVRLFEEDGLTEYKKTKDGLVVHAPKRAYRLTYARDAAGDELVGAANYSTLPVVPFFANAEKRGELTPSIKSKIDLYDRILSDFGDNLDKANDVYWVLNNFGGTMDDICEMLEQISRIKAVANISDGTTSSTAEPKSFEVPYQARRAALDILQRQLYQDYMALDMDELTGGSLTNVAIKAATANLNLKADRYEWQAFSFVQGILRLLGIKTERITFKRQTIANETEIIQNIVAMRQDISHEKALALNPYVMQEEIPQIMQDVAAEQMTGAPSMVELERMLREKDNG